MRTVLLTLAATAALTTAASAQPIRTRVYAVPVPPPGLVDPEDWQDYRLAQVERRQEGERAALRFNQSVERRTIDPDEDIDIDD